MNYPRLKNGWIDNGLILKTKICPNCNSNNFKETISLEHCSNCNYKVDYWGDGSNDVAERYFNSLKQKEEDYWNDNDYWKAKYNEEGY